MKTIGFYLLCALLIVGCKQEASQHHISYTISQQSEEGQSALTVKLHCEAEPDGTTTLVFLNDSWGETELHNTLHNMTLENESYSLEIQKDSGWISIIHPKGIKTIDFQYSIKQDTDLPLTSDKTYRPVVQPEYFHVFAHGLFMLPKAYSETSDQTFDVEINWEGFPETFTIQNSFGSNERQQLIEDTTQGYFMQSVFLGGDYRTHHINIKGNTVVFSTRDEWEVVEDSTLVALLKTTLTVQRDFWQDHSQDYFSVTLSPTILENGSSFQGTGLTNSFDCHASNNSFLEIEGLVYLFNHELMHNWIGRLINNEDEEAQYWFSEGFTEYYTIKNIAKHNIYNLGHGFFIEQLNDFISLLHASPVKEAPNTDINYDNFWKDYNYEKLPYRRGALFAFYLDLKIQKEYNGEKSLDDVMRAIKADALDGQKLNHEYFISKVNLFLKEDLTPIFNRHIEDGKLIDLKALFSEFDLDHSNTALVYDRGFSYDKETKEITAVTPGSNAFEAGIRVGDILKDWNIYWDNLQRNSRFVILRSNQELTIEYRPSKTIELPQLKNSEKNISHLFSTKVRQDA